MNDKLTKPFAKYPHIRKVGKLYFLAGQGCRCPETNEYRGTQIDSSGNVLSYDIKEQTLGVLENINRALKSANLQLNNLCDVSVFLKTMDDFEKMNSVWNEFFKNSNPPTRTTVAVSNLPGNNFIEMKAIASEDQ